MTPRQWSALFFIGHFPDRAALEGSKTIFLYNILDLCMGILYFCPENICRNSCCTVTENDQLFHTVGGRHPHAILFSHIIGGFFDLGVCRLCLFGVDDMDILVFFYRTGISFDFICIKHQNDTAFSVTLIVAEHIG